MPRNLIALFLLTCVLISTCDTASRYEVSRVAINTTCDPNYYNFTINMSQSVFNMTLTVFQEIPALSVQAMVLLKPTVDRNAQWRTLFNVTGNVCQLLHDREQNPFVGMLYKRVLSHSDGKHIFTSCPIKKGYYFINNMDLVLDMLPPMWPDSHFYYQCILSMEGNELSRVSAKGLFRNRRAKRQKN